MFELVAFFFAHEGKFSIQVWTLTTATLLMTKNIFGKGTNGHIKDANIGYSICNNGYPILLGY